MIAKHTKELKQTPTENADMLERDRARSGLEHVESTTHTATLTRLFLTTS